MDKDQINSFLLGLNKDIHDKNYQEGHYTFSLNSVNNSINGDNTAISTELGNINCGNLPLNYYPIGKINTGNEIIVFLKDDNSNSEIGMIKNCVYSTIINNPCLNFNKGIKGTFRIINGCDIIIYFVDGENPDRTINISDIINNPEDNLEQNAY